MLPRINSLIDIRDFLILLYNEEKNNEDYFENTNYIITKGRNYIEERKKIVDYFTANTRERTWEPVVFEKHIFHALNLMGFSISRNNLWLVNRDLLIELFNISDGLNEPLNKKEKYFFKKLLFDTNYRMKILFDATEQDKEYVNRWSDIFTKIFNKEHPEISKLFKKSKIPLIKLNIKKTSITLNKVVRKIIQNKLDSDENRAESSIEREMSTFITWNKQLDIIGEIPKKIVNLTLGNKVNLLYRIKENNNDENNFSISIKNNYTFLRKKYEIVQIPILKCLIILELLITLKKFDFYFLKFRNSLRGNITFSSTSPAYFNKEEWGELKEWIYKENGINYLTFRLKEKNINDK